MDTIKINVAKGAIVDGYSKYDIAKIYFGNVTAEVRENARFLLDTLCYCCDCPLLFSDEKIESVFSKHNVDMITDANNLGMMQVLRKIFMYDKGRSEDENGQQVIMPQDLDKRYTVDNGDYIVDVSNDKNIQELFNDPEFQAINTPQTSKHNSPQAAKLDDSQLME